MRLVKYFLQSRGEFYLPPLFDVWIIRARPGSWGVCYKLRFVGRWRDCGFHLLVGYPPTSCWLNVAGIFSTFKSCTRSFSIVFENLKYADPILSVFFFYFFSIFPPVLRRGDGRPRFLRRGRKAPGNMVRTSRRTGGKRRFEKNTEVKLSKLLSNTCFYFELFIFSTI